MNDFSISMALFDYIPVAFFAIGAIILLGDFYSKMSKLAYALFSAGVINVAMAGALKATWKLLYAVEFGDVTALNAMFFPVQSIGFLLAGIAVILMLCDKKKAHNVVEPVSMTMLCVVLMVLGLGFLDAGLCIISKKMKKPAIIAIFAVSFVCCLGMGYLSSKDFEKASMNWIAEGVNFVGQGLFLLGVWMLHKAGLADLKLEKKV